MFFYPLWWCVSVYFIKHLQLLTHDIEYETNIEVVRADRRKKNPEVLGNIGEYLKQTFWRLFYHCTSYYVS